MTAPTPDGRPALWHPSPEAQRREVRVSLGETSLTIRDRQGRAVTHWSLAALTRMNPKDAPALFTAEGGEEALEVTDDALLSDLSDALARARRIKPRHGLVRWALIGAGVLAIGAGLTLWAPGAIRAQAMATIPDVTRMALGEALRLRLQPFTGAPCGEVFGDSALSRLGARLKVEGQLEVLRDGLTGPVALPGGTILIPAAIVEDFDSPEVLSGVIIAAQVAGREGQALGRLLDDMGTLSTIRLLTTGRAGDSTLDRHAQTLLRAPTPLPPADALLPAFRAADVPSAPFAYARDVSGEATLALIEGDPFDGVTPRPLLTDGEWLALQGICDT
ncbi:MAG: hypothetical protein ACU0DW_06405 [Shimia sp.]